MTRWPGLPFRKQTWPAVLPQERGEPWDPQGTQWRRPTLRQNKTGSPAGPGLNPIQDPTQEALLTRDGSRHRVFSRSRALQPHSPCPRSRSTGSVETTLMPINSVERIHFKELFLSNN